MLHLTISRHFLIQALILLTLGLSACGSSGDQSSGSGVELSPTTSSVLNQEGDGGWTGRAWVQQAIDRCIANGGSIDLPDCCQVFENFHTDVIEHNPGFAGERYFKTAVLGFLTQAIYFQPYPLLSEVADYIDSSSCVGPYLDPMPDQNNGSSSNN